MPRGPHDDEIDKGEPEKDRARQRLEEFLKQRGPNPPPPEGQDEEDRPEEPRDPNRNRPAKP